VIHYKTGNILEEDAEALVNSVNCVGFMGRGVALQFKKAWPDNFQAYAAACRRKEVRPGHMFVFETCRLTNPKYIINFPTKRHWRSRARIDDIETGLKALVKEIQRRGIRSIALPPLGAGLGGLKWDEVRVRIERAMSDVPGVNVILFEPAGVPALPKSMRRGAVPKMTPGRAALVGLIDRYLAGLLDPVVSLLEVHKLMYFMQEAGEPLKLRFSKGPYGPYAENLRHVLTAMDEYYVSGYGFGGDAPNKVLTLVPGATEEAQRTLAQRRRTKERFDRVAILVEGFESPFGLELLATVHWLIKRENAMSPKQLTELFYRWANRKRQFFPEQIELAASTLRRRGWINGQAISSRR
jgi:O-acetyl-ADP-ribose deacetylase (regulator of RNase III)